MAGIPPTIQGNKLNETIIGMQIRIKILKTLRGGRFSAHLGGRKEKFEARSEAFAAAIMLSSLVSASVGVPITTENLSENINQSMSERKMMQ